MDQLRHTSKNKRIAQNTLILYFRLLLTLSVSLFTVRIVLNALGVQDYGIYSVVGGLVALLSFLPSAMASATQRYFSFALGTGDEEKLRTTFTVNGVLYVGIALLALLLLETVGLWYVKEHLHVPAGRLYVVLWLYHFSVLTLMTSIITSPFMAIIIAHEDMQIYAYASIVEALLKLAMAWLLVYLAGDKLQLYGLLQLVVAILSAAIYILFCVRRYAECQFRVFHWDNGMLREVIGFTGWTLFGQLTTVVRNQAVTILLNQMFNPAVVAARAIALQVSIQASQFSSNFNTSLYPPIVKSYSAGNREEMYSLVFSGCKITFFLMWLPALPLFIEMDFVLTLWLKSQPESTTLFARLALVEAMITSVSLPLMTAARALGRMRLYELTLGIMQLAVFPVSWTVLQIWKEPWTVFGTAIVANALMFVVRLWIVRRMVDLPVRIFFRDVALPISMVATASAVAALVVDELLPQGLIYALLTVGGSFLVNCACVYAWGLDASWRMKLRNAIARKLVGNRGQF